MRRLLLLAALVALSACSRDPQATARSAAAPARAPSLPAEPAPFLIQGRIAATAADFDGRVGVAIMDLQKGWIAGHEADRPLPQQSVSKLWVALGLLDRVDRGELTLEDTVRIRPDELSVFHQPIAGRVREGDVFTLAELLVSQLADSDNAANDKMMRLAGGPERVRETLLAKGLGGVTVFDYEGPFQSRVAGLPWNPAWAGSREFTAARARLERETREAALDAYVERPYDGASPEAVVRALARLDRGELLSPGSTAALFHALSFSRNGRKRLKGALPPGWSILHKTGTGQDLGPRSVGINDVGILIAPDGRKYAVAVMIGDTRRPVPERLALFQAITGAVVDQWAQDAGAGPASARATPG